MNPAQCISPPLTCDQWVRIVSRHEHPIEHESVQRRGPRFRVRGFASLWVEVDTGFRTVTVSNTCRLLEVSEHGLSLLASQPFATHAPATIEVSVDDASFALAGRVKHCTRTKKGFQIGIALRFDE